VINKEFILFLVSMISLR